MNEEQRGDEELIEMLEIWRPVEIGGEAYRFETKQNLKLVAVIVNGLPVRLEEGFVMEKRHITKEESNKIITTLKDSLKEGI